MDKKRLEYHKKYQKNRYHTDLKFREMYKNLSKVYYKKYQKQILEKKEKQRIEVIYRYSKGAMNCACCGETMLKFLTIDHINNDGNKHRKEIKNAKNIVKWIVKNNFPEGFQIYCWNCNAGKYQNNGVCPHNNY